MSCDWKKIKAEYIRGGTSYRKLAEKYNAPFGSLRKVAAKEKWRELRDEARAKADTKITDAISDKDAERALKIGDVADKLLDRISAIIGSVCDTQGIKHISSALKDIKEIKGIKSELDKKEQTARIAKLEKEAERYSDDGGEEKPCGIVMMPPIMDAPKAPLEDEDG